MNLVPAADELFFTKNDLKDPRLGELARRPVGFAEIETSAPVIMGYPDDEGIRLNGGRPGASLGPAAIRRILYKMTPAMGNKVLPNFFDAGNLEMAGSKLDERHFQARRNVTEILTRGARAVCLGGGHDYGFPDFAAFCEVTLKRNKRPFVINFDAHLDVRPDDKGAHSGTPFYKLLREFGSKIDFFEVGLQEWCNATIHLDWAREQGALIHTLSDIEASGLPLHEYMARFIFSKWTKDHSLALSVDMDGFPSGTAPGASQVFPVGLDPRSFFMMWTLALKKYRPDLIGFYETSPPLDFDDRTSRLAAILLHRYISPS